MTLPEALGLAALAWYDWIAVLWVVGVAWLLWVGR